MARKLLLLVLFYTVTQWAQAQAPVANFSSNVRSGCAPLAVSFKDESTGNPTFWNWDFGGGNLSNLQNPTMTFSTPGTYTVTLVVRNADGTHGRTETNYITVNPSPRARFHADQTIGCVPSTIKFWDDSDPIAGNIVSWFWDFGDGTTSTDPEPSHQYATTGFYTVLLRVISSTGCENATSIGRYIRIVPGVTVNFDKSIPATCRAPFGVNFTNLSSGPGNMTYQWNFGNSTGSNQESPAATYGSAGTYTVTLNATSEFGCTGSAQQTVNISGTGTTFNSADTVCINTPVSFQNASTTPPTSSSWDFGNGTQSSSLDGVATYTAAGIYQVKLTNVYPNCTDSFSKPLVVVDNPVVSFSAPVTTACRAPLTVNFVSGNPAAVGWQWDFGDGNTSSDPNPSHTYTTEGEFDVTLTITTRHGCTGTLTQPAFVRIIEPTVAFGNAPTGGCVPFSFTPTAIVTTLDAVATYSWEYGDGFTATTTVPTGPARIYNTPGNYTIKLTITTTGGCNKSVEHVNGIRTGIKPAANFTMAPTDACASDAINFLYVPGSAVPVDEWQWDFGDGSSSTDKDPSHIYADSGYFSVTVTALNNKCPATSPAQVVHIKPPIANFTYDVACPNVRLVNFDNRSKVNPAVYGPTTYAWDFGDGTTSAAETPPPHLFPALGNYTVTLTVSSPTCSHTFTETLKLVSEAADFTASKNPVCKGEPFTLNAITSIPANVTQYEWAIGTAAYVTGGRSANASFTTAGDVRVSLRITDINGCIDEKTVNNAVTITGPTARFTPTSTGGCANTTITFTDASTTGIQSWNFDFGDGSTQVFTAPPFRHQYADTGRFVVKLTVTDAIGCSDTYTTTDTVFITKPVAGFISNFTTICPDTDLPFRDTSSGRNLSYSWDFGDGGTSTVPSPVHRYTATSGDFSVKLVVTDEVGCKDSTIKQNHVTVKKPVPSFTVQDTSSICTLLQTSFNIQGSDYESFYWDFGDGSTSTLPDPTHFYNNYGSYIAKLVVIGYGGCLDSTSDTINVYNPYALSDITYNPLTNCNSITVDFGVTTPPSTRFTFHFGDGANDNSQTKAFQHFYKQPGFYAPSMYLYDSVGCQVVIGGPNTIRVLGVAPYFNADKKTFCDSGTVNFTNFIFPPSEPIASRVWDFGDGITSTDPDPTHRYRQPGTYIVAHTVSTVANNCVNTITDTIRVYGTPHPVINSDTAVCINHVLPLQGDLTVADTSITWSWDLGSNGRSTDQHTTVKYGQAGNYTVSLEAANKLGCKDRTSKNIYVPPTPAITVNGNTTIPVGTGVTIPLTYSDNVATWTWSPAGGLSCTDCPNPFANPKFTTQYFVKVEDIYGCQATQDVAITVVCNSQNYFVPNTFSPNNDGQNDVFMPRGKHIDRVNRMQVFNRWGELVYEKRNFMANDASAGWNGTYKGKPAAADVYVYVIEFVCENASVVPFRGNVTLLR